MGAESPPLRIRAPSDHESVDNPRDRKLWTTGKTGDGAPAAGGSGRRNRQGAGVAAPAAWMVRRPRPQVLPPMVRLLSPHGPAPRGARAARVRGGQREKRAHGGGRLPRRRVAAPATP